MTTHELAHVIGGNVRARRLEKQLTQVQLAKRLNITQARISQIEAGIGDVPGSLLCELANSLGCTVAALVTEKSFSEVA